MQVAPKKFGPPKGVRYGGRKKGTPNKFTGNLKEAIINAAALVGEDGNGKDGLEGYLKRVAMKDERTYLGLVGRVIPHVIEGSKDSPLQHDHKVTFEFK